MTRPNQRSVARVLILDPSPTVSALLRYSLEQTGDVEVAGVVTDLACAEAQMARYAPNIVVMDLRVCHAEGGELARRILRQRAIPVIVVASFSREEDRATAFALLAAGALDVAEKPLGYTRTDYLPFGEELARMVRAVLAVTRIARLPRDPDTGSFVNDTAGRRLADDSVVIIGASSGGPAALHYLVQKLPEHCRLPIVIAQHMRPGYMDHLAQSLAQESKNPVAVVRSAEDVVPGRILLAPEAGLEFVKPDRVEPVLAVENAGLGPSVDVLMLSAARVLRSRCCGFLLTGLGSDGALGLCAMREAKGFTVVENPSSATVAGMPRAALAKNPAHRQWSLDRIARYLATAAIPIGQGEPYVPGR